MSKEFTPHDLFFSKLMEDKEMARALFLSYFPKAVQNYIDLSTAELEHLNPKFVNDVLSGYKVCDVLYKCTSEKGSVILLAHCEHQSYAVRSIPLRAIAYSILAGLSYQQETKEDTIPPILTIIYYNGEKPYSFSMDPLDLFGNIPPELKDYVLFKPMLIDLNKKTDDEFQQHGPFAPFETLFKHSHDESSPQKLQTFCSTISKIPRHLLTPALEYILACIEKKEKEAFIKMIANQVDSQDFVSIADSFREEGREEGVKTAATNFARESLVKGVDVKTVAEIFHLDLEKVKRLKEELR